MKCTASGAFNVPCLLVLCTCELLFASCFAKQLLVRLFLLSSVVLLFALPCCSAALPFQFFCDLVCVSAFSCCLAGFDTQFFIFLSALPVVLSGWQREAVSVLYYNCTQLCLYEATHVTAYFFACSCRCSVLHGHSVEALSQFAQAFEVVACATCSQLEATNQPALREFAISLGYEHDLLQHFL